MVEQTIALFGGITIFNIISCLPILMSSAVRRLFKKLPTDILLVNYFLGIVGFTFLHSAILIFAVVMSGGLEGTGVFWGLGLVTIGVGIIFWATISFIAPKMNWWNPKQEGELDGRIALGLGLIWYFISTGIALFLLLIFLIAFFFPG